MAMRSRVALLALALCFALRNLRGARVFVRSRCGQRRVGSDSLAAFARARSSGRGQHLPARTPLRSSTQFSPSWIPVLDGPTLAPAKGSTVMPVFPLQTIEWPGNTVELKISEPADRRIYENMLLTGERRMVAPLARLPVPGQPVDADAPLEERRLHSLGAVLLLKELREVSEETGGKVKYIAKHKVVGRASIGRLLNPSALFSADGSEKNSTYLKAEVEIVEEPEMEVVQTATAKRLIDSLIELRSICEKLDEPRLSSEGLIKQSVLMMSTWQLVDLWQRLQLTAQRYREKARVHAELQEWIKLRQKEGRLPQQLPRQLDISSLGLPWDLMKALAKTQRPELSRVSGAFWRPLLEIFATEGAQVRRELLLQWVQSEVKLARARSSLKELFA